MDKLIIESPANNFKALAHPSIDFMRKEILAKHHARQGNSVLIGARVILNTLGYDRLTQVAVRDRLTIYNLLKAL